MDHLYTVSWFSQMCKDNWKEKDFFFKQVVVVQLGTHIQKKKKNKQKEP